MTETFEPMVMVPAPGQGALAVECRAEDATHGAPAVAYHALDDAASRAAVTAERALLARLEAGCTAPVGALARPDAAGGLVLVAVVLRPDGQVQLRRTGTAGWDARLARPRRGRRARHPPRGRAARRGRSGSGRTPTAAAVSEVRPAVVDASGRGTAPGPRSTLADVIEPVTSRSLSHRLAAGQAELRLPSVSAGIVRGGDLVWSTRAAPSTAAPTGWPPTPTRSTGSAPSPRRSWRCASCGCATRGGSTSTTGSRTTYPAVRSAARRSRSC